jgi:dTDP-4-dehydrorhamnose reductase
MFIENFNKIYGETLYTQNTMYGIQNDALVVAPNHHVLRLNPIQGKAHNPMTVVLMKTDTCIKMGIYQDTYLNPIAVKDIAFIDMKRFENFKMLLATTIEIYE